MTDLQSLKLPDGSPKTFWTELSLHSSGLSNGDQWAVDAIEKAKEMFPNKGVQHVAAWLAALHPRAIEYLEAAPVLALAVSYGGKYATRQERAYIAMNWRPLVERGDRLKDIMKSFRVAYPFRALSSKAIRPGIWPLLQRLTVNLSPSEIAQAIPDCPTNHHRWISDLETFESTLTRRTIGQSVDCEVLSWAMLALSRRKGRGGIMADPAEVADFITCNREQWNKRWTWGRAVHECSQWHDALANADVDQATGPIYDSEVDYGDFPNRVTIPVVGGGSFEFVALRSLRALYVEGKAMRHCVASYFADVKRGNARIYSIRSGGQRIATAEYRPAIYVTSGTINLVQLKGPCNSAPANQVADVAQSFARALSVNSIPLRKDENAKRAVENARKAAT